MNDRPQGASVNCDCHVLLQVYIAPVDKENLLKQIQALLTEPLGDDIDVVAPALAKACGPPHLTKTLLCCTTFTPLWLQDFSVSQIEVTPPLHCFPAEPSHHCIGNLPRGVFAASRQQWTTPFWATCA